MSQPKTKHKASWVGWIVSALLLIGSAWLWLDRQYVVDAIEFHQFKPSAAVEQINQKAGFTDAATFTFYATRPAVETSASFNQDCARKEATSVILGCYANDRIYIYDVTDPRTAGIKTVTAAHELLHAEYDRLPDSEKKHLQPLLQAVYDRVADSDLKARMQYYQKTEPGEAYNELHSIIGTEISSVGPELEQYYSKYFKDRQSLVRLHTQVDSTFTSLTNEANGLLDQIQKLAAVINGDTKNYNMQIANLNQSVQVFNARASQSGGFTSEQDFHTARQQLITQSDELNNFRQQIQANINEYKTLIARLNSINSESASLSQSLDSTLSNAPKI